MKLEVGMYVRTKHGIRKIIDIDEDNNYYIDKTYINDFRQEINCISDNCIIGEPSFNITDILEVGDYVNGIEIIKIYEKGDSFTGSHNYIFEEKTIEVCNDNYETIPHEALFINNEIETIVTKEQFEQMAYKVGE